VSALAVIMVACIIGIRGKVATNASESPETVALEGFASEQDSVERTLG
jgi:hypothetical protein